METTNSTISWVRQVSFIPAEKHQRNIMDLHGLGKELWEGIDAQEYVNELRKEWDHRP